MVERVAALCVAPNSIYKQMEGVAVYDKRRDVRTFTGGMPVVAHPPCRAWSAYTSHQAKPEPGEAELGLICADHLRNEGGGTGAPGALQAVRCSRPAVAWAAPRPAVHRGRAAGVVGLPDAQGDLALLLRHRHARA